LGGGICLQKTLSTSADAEIILKLYELRTEAVMRQARKWATGEFWPATADEFFSVYDDFGSQKNDWLRQVVTYWEMAASLVLHGALSSDLYIEVNSEPFFLLAKFAPILPAIHERMPHYFSKTLQLTMDFQPAFARYEAAKTRAEHVRGARRVH
jgi:hypothetical protein